MTESTLHTWETPIPFDDLETPSIPTSILSSPLAEYASAMAHAAEVPEALVVMTILGMISTALAKRFVVSPQLGWSEPVNIYTAIALPPGNNKSLILKACTAPLREWEEQQHSLLEPQRKIQRSHLETEKRIIDGLRRKAASSRTDEERNRFKTEITEKEATLEDLPALPELFATDATPESLASTVYEQNGRFAIISDEGGIIEVIAGLYTSGLSNIDIILKGIDGGVVRIKRKDRSYNISPFLTLVLLVQPSVLKNMASKRSFDGNGLLERFLYTLPKSTVGYRSHNTQAVPEALSKTYKERIQQLLDLNPFTKEQVQEVLTLDAAALQCWQQYRHDIEKELRSTGKLYECKGWGSKISGFCLRIAGLLHAAEYLDSSKVISLNTMERAVQLARLLEEHALAAFNLMGASQSISDAKEVLEWIQNQPATPFKKSDLTYAMRNRKIAQGKRLEEALEVLKERHYLREEIDKSTRRPTTWFEVNPDINK